MIEADRLIQPVASKEDEIIDRAIRPKMLVDYTGQDHVCSQMEDIMIGEGPAARSIKLELPPFTLVGATTRAGSLTSPLRDRFGIVQRLEFYSVKDLTTIVKRSSSYLNLPIDEAGAIEIARRSRGTL